MDEILLFFRIYIYRDETMELMTCKVWEMDGWIFKRSVYSYIYIYIKVKRMEGSCDILPRPVVVEKLPLTTLGHSVN